MNFGEVNKTHFKGLDFSVDLTEWHHACIAASPAPCSLRGGYIKKSREADNKSKDCFSVVGLFGFARGKPGCFLVGPFGGCSFFFWVFFWKKPWMTEHKTWHCNCRFWQWVCGFKGVDGLRELVVIVKVVSLFLFEGSGISDSGSPWFKSFAYLPYPHTRALRFDMRFYRCSL